MISISYEKKGWSLTLTYKMIWSTKLCIFIHEAIFQHINLFYSINVNVLPYTAHCMLKLSNGQRDTNITLSSCNFM